jgi:Zn-dependent oligopeptidase
MAPSPRYYDNAFVEESLNLDDNLVKEYFPVGVVVPAILQIYQELLGVRFRDSTANASLWHAGSSILIFLFWLSFRSSEMQPIRCSAL